MVSEASATISAVALSHVVRVTPAIWRPYSGDDVLAEIGSTVSGWRRPATSSSRAADSARLELVERRSQIALGRLEEAAGDPDRVEVVVVARRDAAGAELVDLRARAGEQDRRMRRDHELRARGGRARDDRQQRQRAADRQCRLGLVEDVEPLAREAVGRQGEERLAVRLLVQRRVAVEREVGRERLPAVDEVRDVEEALGAQEVAGARLGRRQDGLESTVEHRARPRGG